MSGTTASTPNGGSRELNKRYVNEEEIMKHLNDFTHNKGTVLAAHVIDSFLVKDNMKEVKASADSGTTGGSSDGVKKNDYMDVGKPGSFVLDTVREANMTIALKGKDEKAKKGRKETEAREDDQMDK